MLRLYLVAHAPTAAQRLLRFPDDEGIEPVDPTIVEQVLAGIGAYDAVVRGPERRCAETAAALGLEAAACDALQAWSVGMWAGQAVSRVAEHDPEGLRAWRTDPHARPGGGESLTMLIERVSGWMQMQERPIGRVVAIADPTVVRAALLYVLDTGPGSFWRVDVAPWSLAVVQYTHGEWRLRSLGSAD